MKKTAEVTKTSEPTIIRLTKVKQWYIVVDVESYSVLKKLGAPLLRIHQNFLPTLQLLTKKHGVRAKSVDFETEIFDPFMDSTGQIWTRKYGKCSMTSKTLVFQAQDDKMESAREAVTKLESRLLSFFNRWGYKCLFQYSENKTKTRLKFHVEFWFDSDKMPVLPLETPVEELKKIQLKFGFTRITLSFDDMSQKDRKIGYIHLLIEVSQGGSWNPIHSTKCLPTQVSSVLPMMNALVNILNLDQHNLDNEAQ